MAGRHILPGQGGVYGDTTLNKRNAVSLRFVPTTVHCGCFANSSGGELVLDDTKFRGKIAGFTGSGATISDSDAIDLGTVASATATLAYAGTTLSGTLTVTDGTHTAKLAMLGNFAQANFQLGNDGHGDTLITYSATPLHPGG